MEVVSHWSAHVDENGNWVATVEANNEVTELKRTQNALAQAQEQLRLQAQGLEQLVANRTMQLESTVRELESFSYSVAHDMRAPVRAIASFAELLQVDYSNVVDEQGRAYLGRICDSAQRLDTFIADLPSYSQMIREDLPLHTVELRPLIAALIEDRPQLHAPNAEIELADHLSPVLGHESAIRQIMANLLENAVKFVAPDRKPYVCIYTTEKQGVVRLVVEDNGVGVPEHLREQIFRIFERGNTQGAYPGYGVGLAIVSKAASKVGAQVSVEPAPSGGSRFCVELRSA